MKKPNLIIPNEVAIVFHPKMQQIATALIDGFLEFEQPENLNNSIKCLYNEILKRIAAKVGNEYHTMCELADIKKDVQELQSQMRYIAIHSEEVAVC